MDGLRRMERRLMAVIGRLCVVLLVDIKGVMIHVDCFTVLVQLVEHLACNQVVVGSIPTGGSRK